MWCVKSSLGGAVDKRYSLGVSMTMPTPSANRSLIFILAFLLVFSCSSFAAGVYLNSAAAFTLSGAALLSFVGIFAVGVLDYKVGGNQLTLEKRVNSLEKENTELTESVTSLLKSIYVLSHPDSPVAGPSVEQYKLIDEYLSPIRHLVVGDVRAEVSKAVLLAHENGRHFQSNP